MQAHAFCKKMKIAVDLPSLSLYAFLRAITFMVDSAISEVPLFDENGDFLDPASQVR